MSASVDVLAVLDDAATYIPARSRPVLARKHAEARAAVAQLIADFDVLRAALLRTHAEMESQLNDPMADSANGFRVAALARAALSSIGGAA